MSPLSEQLSIEDTLAEELDVSSLVLDVVNEGIPSIDITENLLDGCEIERTINGPSTLTLKVHDAQRAILNSGLISSQKERLIAVDIEVDEHFFRMVKIAKGGDDLTLTFEEREVAYLRQHDKPRKVSRNKMTRAQFAHHLVREVKAGGGIKFYSPERDIKQPITKSEQRVTKTERREGRKPGISSSANLRVKGARAGRGQIENMERVLDVANSIKAGPKATLALVLACIVESQFRNLPYGDRDSEGILQVRAQTARSIGINNRSIEQCVSHFLRKGFWGKGGAIDLARRNPSQSAGWVAQQTQGSAHPGRYDIFRNEGRAIIRAYGGEKGDSGKTSVNPRAYKQFAFARGGKDGKKEDSWTALRRLAEEVGWACFAGNGVIWFVSEEYLFKAKPRYKISERSPGINNISFDWDSGKLVAALKVDCQIERWPTWTPGGIIEVEDCGPANGRWLIETVRRGLFSSTGSIDLRKPMPVKPEPATESTANFQAGDRSRRRSSSGGGSSGRGRINRQGGAQGIVDDAVRISKQAGGSGVYVASAYRPGDPLDHGSNNAAKAARDIAVRGIDALVGPPSPKLDKAVVAIGKEFGRNYGSGRTGRFQSADTFQWKGYRVQIIWRTPRWGGHMGHIHIGVKRGG